MSDPASRFRSRRTSNGRLGIRPYGHCRAGNGIAMRSPPSRSSYGAWLSPLWPAAALRGCGGWLRRGAGDPFDACRPVTRPNQGGHANCMVRRKYHLRDARKRHGADARRTSQLPGAAPALDRRTRGSDKLSPNGACEIRKPQRLSLPHLAGSCVRLPYAQRVAAPLDPGQVTVRCRQGLGVGPAEKGADLAPLLLRVRVTQRHQLACITGLE